MMLGHDLDPHSDIDADVAQRTVLFIDFCSVPQHNKEHPAVMAARNEGRFLQPGEEGYDVALRNSAEQLQFEHAIQVMHFIYSPDVIEVNVHRLNSIQRVPIEFCGKDFSNYSINVVPYDERGWCYFEAALARSWADRHHREIQSPSEFLQTMKVKVFTNAQDALPGLINYITWWLRAQKDLQIRRQAYSTPKFRGFPQALKELVDAVLCASPSGELHGKSRKVYLAQEMQDVRRYEARDDAVCVD